MDQSCKHQLTAILSIFPLQSNSAGIIGLNIEIVLQPSLQMIISWVDGSDQPLIQATRWLCIFCKIMDRSLFERHYDISLTKKIIPKLKQTIKRILILLFNRNQGTQFVMKSFQNISHRHMNLIKMIKVTQNLQPKKLIIFLTMTNISPPRS